MNKKRNVRKNKHYNGFEMKMIKKSQNVNAQYSYTTPEAIALKKDEKGNFDWLPSKEGQSIKQWWLDRIKQTRSARDLKKAVPLGVFGVLNDEDEKLDDKIREHMCNYDYHIEIDYEDDGQGTEWVETYVKDIYDDLGWYPKNTQEILDNDEFLELWYKRISASKISYLDEQNLKIEKKLYNLRPWQELALQEMLKSGKSYHQLGLPPRFGKTLLILEYIKQKHCPNGEFNEKIVVVPLSKSLSSNSSFYVDYKQFGFDKYFKLESDLSLFLDTDKLIEKIKETVKPGTKIIPVTDEGDQASHTILSVERMEVTKKEFNIEEHITMTGTGFGKLSKILRNTPNEEIHTFYMTYEEMVEMGGDVVKRRFFDIKFSHSKTFLGKTVTNIRETISDPIHHEDLSKFLGKFTHDKHTEKRLELLPTDIVMVFLKPEKNQNVIDFSETFQNMFNNEIRVECMVGRKGWTNKNAQVKVKKIYKNMKKLGDNRKLVLISCGIGSRSFSVSSIIREINFNDNELTHATIQEFARVLTHKEGKTHADIIRISFSEADLAEELFLVENQMPTYDNKTRSRVTQFLNYNSFAKILIDDNGELISQDRLYPNGVNENLTGEFIDNLCKYSDNLNYLNAQLWSVDLICDVEPTKISKSITSVISKQNLKNKRVNITNNKISSSTKTSKDEERRKYYIDILRHLPTVFVLNDFDSVEDFLNNGEWKKYIGISKKDFIENYKNETFKNIMDSLVRNTKKLSKKDLLKKHESYLKFIGF